MHVEVCNSVCSVLMLCTNFGECVFFNTHSPREGVREGDGVKEKVKAGERVREGVREGDRVRAEREMEMEND